MMEAVHDGSRPWWKPSMVEALEWREKRKTETEMGELRDEIFGGSGKGGESEGE